MTTARRKRKEYCSIVAAVAGIAAYACLIFVLTAVPPTADAGASERVVADWHTGLAINGYDPVGFFTDNKPLPGNPDFELRYGGVVWRFINVGNRAAFAANPEVYAPQYGGYDPLGVARGIAVAGNPNEWLIADNKLFLFYDGGRRRKFAGDPDTAIGAADRKWAGVLGTLTP